MDGNDGLMQIHPRVASHPDDPEAPLADRLLLALGMWPSYIDELGVDNVLAVTVALRTDAHLYPMCAEDYGMVSSELDLARELLHEVQDALQFHPTLRAKVAVFLAPDDADELDDDEDRRA